MLSVRIRYGDGRNFIATITVITRALLSSPLSSFLISPSIVGKRGRGNYCWQRRIVTYRWPCRNIASNNGLNAGWRNRETFSSVLVGRAIAGYATQPFTRTGYAGFFLFFRFLFFLSFFFFHRRHRDAIYERACIRCTRVACEISCPHRIFDTVRSGNGSYGTGWSPWVSVRVGARFGIRRSWKLKIVE